MCHRGSCCLLRVQGGSHHHWSRRCGFRDQLLFQSRRTQPPALAVAGYFSEEVAVTVPVERDYGNTGLLARLTGHDHGQHARAAFDALDQKDALIQPPDAILARGEGLGSDREVEGNGGVNSVLREQSNGAQNGAEAESDECANDKASHLDLLFSVYRVITG